MKKHKGDKLPASFKEYFWDVEFKDVDIEKNPQFVLKRIIDRGNTKALLWVLKRLDKNDIRKLITSSRDLSKRTASFWAFILNIDPKEVPCLQKPYSRIHFGPSK